jgi:transcriptional regulator with PAS, ATPase and Fis domain
MIKSTGLSRNIEDLIHNPPRNWRVLSQAIVNASRNCLLAVDHHGVIFLANSIAHEKLGVAVRILLKDVAPELVNIVDKTIADSKRRIENSMQVKSVEYRVSVSPVKLEDELIGVICTLEESTEFEKVARKMRFFQLMTRELEAIIDSSSDGLFVCDAEANVIHVNPASERIHKIKAKELIGKNMMDLIQQGFIDHSTAETI